MVFYSVGRVSGSMISRAVQSLPKTGFARGGSKSRVHPACLISFTDLQIAWPQFWESQTRKESAFHELKVDNWIVLMIQRTFSSLWFWGWEWSFLKPHPFCGKSAIYILRTLVRALWSQFQFHTQWPRHFLLTFRIEIPAGTRWLTAASIYEVSQCLTKGLLTV
jgi:hypothetical protein